MILHNRLTCIYASFFQKLGTTCCPTCGSSDTQLVIDRLNYIESELALLHQLILEVK
jgi:uncharacterized Zn finger protein (UPF0148 family)